MEGKGAPWRGGPAQPRPAPVLCVGEAAAAGADPRGAPRAGGGEAPRAAAQGGAPPGWDQVEVSAWVHGIMGASFNLRGVIPPFW